MLRADGTTEHVLARSNCLVLEAHADQVFDLLAAVPSLHAQLAVRAFHGKTPLQAILDYPPALAAFVAYQKSEFASESSEFYIAVTAFRAAASAGTGSVIDESLRSLASNLIDDFVREGAQSQINIDSSMQRALLGAIEQPKLDAGLFDGACAEVCRLMGRYTLPRFLKSDGFQAVLEAIGEVEPFYECATVLSLNDARAASSRASSKNGDPKNGAEAAPVILIESRT